MVPYVVRKLASTVLVMLAVSVVVFVLIRSVPGDPVRLLAPADASPEFIIDMTRRLGLDQPLWVQYFKWLSGALRGDLGDSIVSRAPVLSEITARYPSTFFLALASTVIALAMGVALGLISAFFRGSVVDLLATTIAVAGISFPSFWIALILIVVFSVQLGWLPSAGKGTLAHLVLPSVALAVYGIGVIARLTRISVVEVYCQDYIRTARAKGVREVVVLLKHVLKNALVPVLTMTGLIFAFGMTRAVVIETVFAYPGMGKLLVDSILLRDYPMIQGAILLLALTYALANLAVDILYSLLDPRIKLGN